MAQYVIIDPATKRFIKLADATNIKNALSQIEDHPAATFDVYRVAAGPVQVTRRIETTIAYDVTPNTDPQMTVEGYLAEKDAE